MTCVQLEVKSMMKINPRMDTVRSDLWLCPSYLPCLVRWVWCRHGTLLNIHLLWIHHHTFLQRLPCSLCSKKNRCINSGTRVRVQFYTILYCELSRSVEHLHNTSCWHFNIYSIIIKAFAQIIYSVLTPFTHQYLNYNYTNTPLLLFTLQKDNNWIQRYKRPHTSQLNLQRGNHDTSINWQSKSPAVKRSRAHGYKTLWH